MQPDQTNQLDQLALLADGVRRRVYRVVAARFPKPVDRDEVAEAAGVSRGLAAFHLDRLAAGGLVEISYARRSGRTGPGAGRPAKFYRRAARAITVSLPDRRFDLATRVFAEVANKLEAREHVIEEARAEGERIAVAEVRAGSSRTLAGVLAEQGFEPEHDGTTIRLRNCPFDAVAARESGAATPVVCTMARAFVEGIVHGLGADAEVRANSRPHLCCVAVEVPVEV